MRPSGTARSEASGFGVGRGSRNLLGDDSSSYAAYFVGTDDDDEDTIRDSAREAMILAAAKSRAQGREKLAPAPGPPGQKAARSCAWGGGLRRVADVKLAPMREDQQEAPPGRYVPIGYARYDAETVRPTAYKLVHGVGGWRIAVPRGMGPVAEAVLLNQIASAGPQAAGYARQGDTLVPAALGPGDRAALAGSAGWYEAWPLST